VRSRVSVLSFALVLWACAPPESAPDDASDPTADAPNPVFEAWDKNGDGYITRDELPPEYASISLASIDPDGDGKVSRAEHGAMMDAFRRERSAASLRRVLPADARTDLDIVYATVGPRRLLLDLYRPAPGAEPLPLIVWFHGGGWQSGSKNFPSAAAHLVARGYAIASVEYRLAIEAIFPAAIEDGKAAVSFLRAHAAEYGLDPARIGAFGESVGGHLAVMLGTTNDVRDFDVHPNCARAAPTVQAVCDWFGPTDLLHWHERPTPQDPEALFLGGPVATRPELSKRASPITWASRGDPPTLIMHGDADRTVPFRHSELLHAALREHGVDVELYRVAGAGHGFRGATESRDALIERVARFFDAKLRGR
jgi:acetyl esterase/lipase